MALGFPELIFCAGLLLVLYNHVSSWRQNIAKARKTGFPYIAVPFSPIFLPWQLTHKIWVPLIQLLPKSLWERWLFVMIPDWGYKFGQTPFERLGSETFIVAYPNGLFLHSQSAEVIHRMTQRREAFPKDVAQYGVLKQFGQNVVTTEGPLWRMHRKVTSASFNEKNAAHTFAEAISQTQGLLSMWFSAGSEGGDGGGGETGSTTRTIRSLDQDTQRWALNIIGYVGFGLRLLWPGQALPKDIDPRLVKYGSLDPAPGHTLSFAESVAQVLDRILAILIVPQALLKILPFQWSQQAYRAKVNYLQYMDEFLRDKIEEAQSGATPREGMDIMGQLVQSKYGSAKPSSPTSNTSTKLSDPDIIGNAFIMTVAGHETTANTLHFSLLALATTPAAQRRLQADIDALFGRDSDPSTWDYELHINALLASHAGACVNETLRLVPPVTGIPKIVTPEVDQTLVVDGQAHVLPRGMSCSLMAVCAHRNPRWWPAPPPPASAAAAAGADGGKGSDLDEYVPERWYRSVAQKNGNGDGEKDEEDDGEDYGGFRGSDVSAALFRPVRGSYVPFSDGPRSCLGRRIAMVELVAALAVIFQRYSVELAVDEWVGGGGGDEEEVQRMGREQRRGLYKRAQVKSWETIRQAESVLTLKLFGGKHVPVRLVRRGCERFVSDPELF